MKVTIKGKRGGTKLVDVRTLQQLEDAIGQVAYGYDRKHEQMMILGSFIAEQLVEINQAVTNRRVRSKSTRPSEWNRFFAAGMKAGKSPTEVGREWQERKVKRFG